MAVREKAAENKVEIPEKALAAVREAHKKYQGVHRRRRNLEKADLLARYDLGVEIGKVERKYGEATMPRLARYLKENETLLRRCERLAATWPNRNRFEKLVKKGMSWMSAQALSQVDDQKLRKKLEEIADRSPRAILDEHERLRGKQAREQASDSPDDIQEAPEGERSPRKALDGDTKAAAIPTRPEDADHERWTRGIRGRISALRANALALIKAVREHPELLEELASVLRELENSIPSEWRGSSSDGDQEAA